MIEREDQIFISSGMIRSLVSDSPVASHLWFVYFPFVHSALFLDFCFCVLFSVRSHTRFPLVLHLFFDYSPFILHLFSICPPFVFRPPYVCFSFIAIYFTLVLHFPPPSFVFTSILHLFSIYSSFHFPFISPLVHEAEYGFVRGQGSIPFCRMIDLPLEISWKPANGCQGETQSFPGRTLHVRLGSEIRGCSCPNRNARTPTPRHSKNLTSYSRMLDAVFP